MLVNNIHDLFLIVFESLRLFHMLDMDCDGLKKSLLIDIDGSLFGYVGTVVSRADVNWG